MGDPIRETVYSDEACPVEALFTFDHDDASGKVLFKGAKGQALRSLRFVIKEVFSTGTIVIGVSGATSKFLASLNLATLAVDDVIDCGSLLSEFSADTEVIVTLTGNPTTGKFAGVAQLTQELNRAK